MNDTISVTISGDKSGYVGRECPSCEQYFKIVPGTGLPGPAPCHCPYCGHTAEQSDFVTPEQIEYAKSVALRHVEQEIYRHLKSIETPPGSRDFLQIKVTGPSSSPLFRYREKDLETEVTCLRCTLKYAVYGVFAYCPDCAQHNSSDILGSSLDCVLKAVTVAEQQPDDVRDQLLASALFQIVSAFDAFGREAVRVATLSRSTGPVGCSFQNLAKARTQIERNLGFDPFADSAPEDVALADRQFQKRHLLAHRMGVVDQGYIDATGDTSAIVGRKATVSADELRKTIDAVRRLAAQLQTKIG